MIHAVTSDAAAEQGVYIRYHHTEQGHGQKNNGGLYERTALLPVNIRYT